MRTDPIEYLPATEERGPQNNGKVFRLAPAQDDFTVQIIRTRQEVLEHGSLTDGARTLFCWLLDNSLRWTVNRARGVITISQTKLSERLKRSKRAISGWSEELSEAGFIWISKWTMPNMWPICTYHITFIDPPDERLHQIVTGDGMWGNHARRRELEEPGPGARQPGQLPLSAQKHLQNPFRGTKRHASQKGNSSKPQQNGAGSGKEQPLSGASFATGRGGFVHRGVAQNDTGESQETTTGSRTKQHLAVAANVPGPSHQTALYKESKGGDKRDSEGSVCVQKPPTHTIPEFEPLDRKVFLRLRQSDGKQMIDFCERKVNTLLQSRTPPANKDEQVAAYKARMKEVKAWMAGQL